ncbi:YwiC-like family protein [Tessaracoccus flavus]|uniref:Uncharacterized protein n=1 Tax=Tessaracoccus flavus TaxID=1610493 RepID=A0A1Q2CH93_9ACTN|nr:YwiC-like family protein [Tessaracoccus flavus]AQP45482.1 hypothetical protein RPIT_12275 [Tessaracoccus flavus]SDY91129.1 YwiC-like protein [Tessaracoccus flavus]
MARKIPAGWVPKQHGAWAMIIVPYVTGLLLAARLRPLEWSDATLGLTWLVGYFAFNAATLWLKAPARRRASFQTPLITYLGISAVFGVATLIQKGWPILIWVPPYAVVLGISLWLAASKRERSLLSGVLTVVASCGLMAVLRPWPADDPARLPDLAVMAAVTLYFVGTVFHVKALIRERNDPHSARRSGIYHTAVLAALVAGIGLGWLTWPWSLWGVALVGRSFRMPRAPRRPLQIGLVEIALSTWALLLVLFA